MVKSEEAFYHVEYILNKDSLEEIQLGLIDWREWIVDQEAPVFPPKRDVINTTHFSAMLNCDMYEWNRKSYEEAVKYYLIRYPYGIPIDEHDKMLYHITTLHVEKGEVPYAPLFFEKDVKSSAPYIPPKPKRIPSPPCRRGDM